jgi:hypothetical protein
MRRRTTTAAVGASTLLLIVGIFAVAVQGATAATTTPLSRDSSASSDHGSVQISASPGARVPVAVGANRCTEGSWDFYSIAYHPDRGTPDAGVCFVPLDDLLYICDFTADGHSAWAQVLYKGKYSRYRSRYGSGYCDVLNWNLEEFRYIGYQAEVWEGDDWLYQGGWVDSNTSA